MNWEIFDLDGDEIVIRSTQTSRRWGEAPSSKRMPRSAGSVNRARRCEQVQELIRFCGVNDTDTPNPQQQTVRQYGRNDNVRKIRGMASVPNLRGAVGDMKSSKSRLRLRSIPTREESPGKSQLKVLQSPINDSTRSLHVPRSPRHSFSQTRPRRSSIKKTVNRRYYDTGVTAVSLMENSGEGIKEGYAETHNVGGDCAPQYNQVVDATSAVSPPRFVNPWESRRNAASYGKGSLGQSTMSSHRPSPSDEWIIRASDSEYDTPSTPATSAFSSIASPAQSPRANTKPFAKDSQHIDSRCLPQRRSSKMVQEVTVSTRRTRLSPQASQEYLVSRVQEPPGSSTTNMKSKRNGRHWPLGRPSLEEDGNSQTETESLAPLKLSAPGSDDSFFQPPMRERLMSAPSVPAMCGTSSGKPRSADGSEAVDLSSTRSHSINDLLSPLPNLTYQSQPPQSPTFAKPARNTPFHRRGMATTHANLLLSTQQTSLPMRKPEPHWSRLPTRAPPPITIPEQSSRTPSGSLPLSPRTDWPSSPPNIPLPADPPVPPSRTSSLYRTVASRPANTSSESLVDPALASNCSTQDSKRIILSRPALRRNASDYTMSSREEVPQTSHSAPLSLASSARVSRIDQQDDSTSHNTDPTDSTSHWHSQPSYTPPTSRTDFNPLLHGPSPLASQPSRPRALSPSASLPPDRLESRLAFLERQNKILQAALIAALDAGVRAGVAVGHDGDSPRASRSAKLVGSADASPTPVSGSGSGSTSGSQSASVSEKDGPAFMR